MRGKRSDTVEGELAESSTTLSTWRSAKSKVLPILAIAVLMVDNLFKIGITEAVIEAAITLGPAAVAVTAVVGAFVVVSISIIGVIGIFNIQQAKLILTRVQNVINGDSQKRLVNELYCGSFNQFVPMAEMASYHFYQPTGYDCHCRIQ